MESDMKKKITASSVLACLVLVVAANGCSTVPSSTDDKDVSYAEKNLSGTPLGQMAAQLAAGKDSGESGFLLLDRGHNALAWRLFMADRP
jgi:hypothetical protein